MEKKDIWKWIILIGLTAGSIALVYPPSQKIPRGLDIVGGSRFVLQVEQNADADAVDRAVEVIRNRVDAMGTAEPSIYTEKGTTGSRIVVEIPGIEKAAVARARDMVNQPAFLEFRMVHPRNDMLVDELFKQKKSPMGYVIARSGAGGDNYYQREGSRVEGEMTEEKIREQSRSFGVPSPEYELLLEEVERDGATVYRPYFVNRRSVMTGSLLENARVEFDQMGKPEVAIQFTSAGADTFKKVTEEYAPGGAKNLNRQTRWQLGIVLDGTLKSAPQINEPIPGGRARIMGRFTFEEARDLSIVLKAGAMPVKVTLDSQMEVSPSLGEDSIKSGTNAAIIGSLAVLGFMILYYRMAGFVANVALLMNLVLLPIGLIITAGLLSAFASSPGSGGMSLPTLTLPGIAGIALTIGMAVDANVLIYERMREEQALGKRLKAIVAAGYDKAFSAIFDSNITTILAGVILFWQGTGPVRGYALTLCAGIIVSMYTALVVTRMLFDFIAKRSKADKLSMMSVIPVARVNYLGKARVVAALLSVAVIGGSWFMFIKRGEQNFGVDFLGGTYVEYGFKDRVPMNEVRDVLEAAKLKPTIQYHKLAASMSGAATKEALGIKVGYRQGEQVTQELEKKWPGNFSSLGSQEIGPQIGSELQRKATIAVILSLVMIVIYVSIRFELPYAIGAVVALLHDVAIGVGVYCVLGNELNANMVAALLTIIGYSVNDTIVIFDRIRENLKLSPGRSFAEVANESINQTMSRTLLTSFATMLTVASLLVYGGGAVQDFALLLFIGMISGVYSTIYIATPVVMLWQKPARAVPAKAASARA